MSSPEKGPLGRFVSFAWSVLLACVLLWTAVWLFQQIVWWLVALVLLAGIVWAAIWFVQWRRDRWLR